MGNPRVQVQNFCCFPQAAERPRFIQARIQEVRLSSSRSLGSSLVCSRSHPSAFAHRSQMRRHGAHESRSRLAREATRTRACVSRRSRVQVVASPPPLPPSRRSACHSPLLFHFQPTAHPSPHCTSRAPAAARDEIDAGSSERSAQGGPPPHARAGRREATRGGGWRWAWCSTARSWRWIWRWPGCRWRWRSPSSPSSPPCSAPPRSSTTPSPPRRPSRRPLPRHYRRRNLWVHS